MRSLSTQLRRSAIVIILAGIAACGGTSGGTTTAGACTATATVKIGVSTAQSGTAASYGHSITQGVNMAVDELNAKGCTNGKKVAAVILDDTSTVNTAVTNTQQLVLQDQVVAILGPVTSAQCQNTSSISKQNKVPFIAATCNSYQLTEDPKLVNPYYVSVVPNTYMEGTSIGIDMGRKTQYTKYFVVSPNYLFGTSETNAFVTSLKKTNPNATIVNANNEYVPFGTKDWTPTIAQIQAANPDVIYGNIFAADAAGFINTALQTDPQFFTKHFFTTLTSVDDLRGLGDKYPLGIRAYTRAPFYAISGTAIKDFVTRYLAKYSGEYPSDWAVLDYDAVNVWAQAVTKAGSFDPDKTMAVLKGGSFTTLRGKITIRKEDGQANVDEWIGTTVKDPAYPFPILGSINDLKGDQLLPPVDKVLANQAGNCPNANIFQCP